MKARPHFLLGFVLALFSIAAGQDAQQPDLNQRILELNQLQGEVGEYRVGSGDLIEIQVFGVEELSRSVRVSASGGVTLPFVGHLDAAGSTTMEIEARLKSLLEEKEFIKNPEVTVLVTEYRSQPVQVLGAVNNAGRYFLNRPLRLTGVLAMAGGIDPELAGSEVVITRDKPAASGEVQVREVLRVDLNRLLQQGDVLQNIVIQSGDVVHVPEREARLFYVIGDVHRPGAFELPDKRDLRITQALAQAGGTMKTAKNSKGLLVRFDEAGQRQDIKLNLNRIMRGKNTDIPVLPNDVIFVPGSTAKSIGYGLLGVVPRALSDAIRR